MRVVSFMSDLLYSGIDAAADHSKWIDSLPINKYDPNWLNRVPWNKASDGVQRAVQGDILKIDAINTLSKPGVYMPTGETGYQSILTKHSGLDGTGTRLGFQRGVTIPAANATQTEIPNLETTSLFDDVIKRQTAHSHPDSVNGINLMDVPRAPSPIDVIGSSIRKHTYERAEGAGSYNPELVYTMEGNKPTAYDYQAKGARNGWFSPNAFGEQVRNVFNDAGIADPVTNELSKNYDDYANTMNNRSGQLKWGSSTQNPAQWLDYRKTGGIDESNIPLAKPVPITEAFGSGMAGSTTTYAGLRGGQLLQRRMAAKAAQQTAPSVSTMVN